jgi:HAD superfamily hydrolase (TIGR01509 family)
MDGVIVNSEEMWRIATNPFFQILIPGWREKNHDEIVGMGVEDVYAHLVRKYGIKEKRTNFIDSCEKVALEIYDQRVSLPEGLLSFLNELREKKMPLGLASSSPKRWIERVLQRFDLAPYFSSILSAEDVHNKTKPAPDLYLESAKNLHAAPENCLAIEDSTPGIRAAKAAGFFCLGFRNGSNSAQNFSLADAEINGFGELLGRVKKTLL